MVTTHMKSGFFIFHNHQVLFFVSLLLLNHNFINLKLNLIFILLCFFLHSLSSFFQTKILIPSLKSGLEIRFKLGRICCCQYLFDLSLVTTLHWLLLFLDWSGQLQHRSSSLFRYKQVNSLFGIVLLSLCFLC